MVLSVCGNLYANANHLNISQPLNQILNQIDCDDANVTQEHDFVATFLQATLEKENDLVFSSDNEVAEDEKLLSIKKDLTNSSYFSTVLYAEQLGCLCNNVKKRIIRNSLFVPFPTTKLNVLLGVYLI